MTPRFNRVRLPAGRRPAVDECYGTEMRPSVRPGRSLWGPVPVAAVDAQVTRRRPAQGPAARFRTTLTPDQMKGKQAVVETARERSSSSCTPRRRPTTSATCSTRPRAGAYDGTVVPSCRASAASSRAAIRSRRIRPRRALYGTGGLNGSSARPTSEKHLARRRRGRPACPTSRTAPARSSSSASPTSPHSTASSRSSARWSRDWRSPSRSPRRRWTRTDGSPIASRSRKATVRDTPPAEPAPFCRDAVEELAQYRATLETTLGDHRHRLLLRIVAPEHVRNFLRLAQSGSTTARPSIVSCRRFAVQAGDLRRARRRYAGAAQGSWAAAARVQRTQARGRHREHGARRRPRQRQSRRSSSARRRRRRSTASTRRSAACSQGMDVVTRSSRRRSTAKRRRTRIGIMKVTRRRRCEISARARRDDEQRKKMRLQQRLGREARRSRDRWSDARRSSGLAAPAGLGLA